MLDTATKRRIDDCRDILVGKLPDPKAQIEQITIGLIYKFMDDMDKEAIELGGTAKFFSGEFQRYSWDALFDSKVTAIEMLGLYSEAIVSMDKNPNIPPLFRNIFKNAYLPYRDPETLKLFLKTIGEFEYTHSEKLGDAFEYLLSVMGSQGDAGQFRTPRHIIDFLVAVVDPGKTDTILDPACGTAGFLISAFKHIREKNNQELTPDERKKLIKNFGGYDISPDMVRLSLVNLYLHGFSDPHISEYDTLSSEDRWDEAFDVILANPPFMSPKGGIRPHKRFTISSSRSEVLFVDYIAEHLNPKGRAGIIVPEGVIFQSGTAYKDLRKMLVDNYLYAVVSLPAGIFNPYSGVKTSILLMDKELAKTRQEILFVKVANDGYNLGAQRNAVKGGQLDDAIEILKQFKAGDFIESDIAHAVLKSEIAKKGDYNLSGERYKITDVQSSIYEFISLSNIAELQGGYAFKSEDLKEDKLLNDYPVIKIGNLKQNGKVSIEASQYYPFQDALEKFVIYKNDILVAMTGATVGKTAISDFDNLLLNQRVGLIRSTSERINREYLSILLLSDIFYNYCQNNAGGGAQGNISPKEILNFKIPLPPLSIQEEIVAEIGGYQKIIDGAKMVVENYKPKIDIDPEWEMVELGDISDFKNGLNFSKESTGEKIKILGVSHFKNNLIAPISDLEEIQVDVTLNDNYLLKKGDIIFVRSNGNTELVGRSIVVPEVKERISFSGFTIRCRLKDGIEPLYIGYLFKSVLHSKIMKNTGRGANIRNLSQEILNDIVIPIPPKEIQQQIVIQLEKEQELVNANKQLIEIFEQKIKDRIGKVWGE
ncbi:MAG TPA: N-6 DNA methylase [Prolixibacteraceae bacterium]|jgi:type I restriction enzyme M protein|nr:N-6 DNA methylase [Prolixibacteraceae bacterium]